MTTQQKNKISVILTVITSTGILSMCVYGFIAYGRMTTKLEDLEKNQIDHKAIMYNLDEKKADKEDVTKMWEDVKYIRTRVDQMNSKDKGK